MAVHQQQLRSDRENVSKLLRETVGVLCRSGLSFSVGLRVQGLLAVTVDDSDVFVVQFDDLLNAGNTGPSLVTVDRQQGQTTPYQLGGYGSVHPVDSSSVSRPSRRRCRGKNSTAEYRRSGSAAGLQQPSKSDIGDLKPATGAAASDIITIGDDVDSDDVVDSADHYVRDFFAAVGSNFRQMETDTCLNGDDEMAAKYGGNAGTYENYDAAAGDFELETAEYKPVIDEDMWCQDAAAQGTAATVALCGRNGRGTISRLAVKQEPQQQNRPAARHIVSKYRQQQRQQQATNSTGVGRNRLFRGSMTTTGSLTITRSVHECGYGGCGKQFQHRQHLLRHQTQKHGRPPKGGRLLDQSGCYGYAVGGDTSTDATVYSQDDYDQGSSHA